MQNVWPFELELPEPPSVSRPKTEWKWIEAEQQRRANLYVAVSWMLDLILFATVVGLLLKYTHIIFALILGGALAWAEVELTRHLSKWLNAFMIENARASFDTPAEETWKAYDSAQQQLLKQATARAQNQKFPGKLTLEYLPAASGCLLGADGRSAMRFAFSSCFETANGLKVLVITTCYPSEVFSVAMVILPNGRYQLYSGVMLNFLALDQEGESIQFPRADIGSWPPTNINLWFGKIILIHTNQQLLRDALTNQA